MDKSLKRRKIARRARVFRVRKKLQGTADKPRLTVSKTNAHIYAQLIDDHKGHTLASASTLEADFSDKVGNTIEGAKQIGQLIAKRALAKSISQVVFDRGGYIYHGRVQACADAAREGGLKF